MLGTIVNAISICVGGFIGIMIKDSMPEKYKTIISQAIGLSVLFVGLSSSISKMILPDANPMLFIISLIVGGLIGEKIGIENQLERFALYIQGKVSKTEGSFAKGFVTSSLMFCVGTMAILGSIESGISGNHNTLFAKSILDGISSIIFGASFGLGVVFSGVSVLIYQGTITLLASFVSPYMSEVVLNEMSMIGGIIIFALGLDVLGIKKIKVGNLLPAIFIPIIYHMIVK